MNCPQCGTVLANGSPFCSTCGANLSNPQPFGAAPTPSYVQQPAPGRTSGMAIAGFVLGLLSCSVLGLIFSIIGFNECKRSFGAVKGEGLAMAGIILSVVWLLVAVTWIAASGGDARHGAPIG